MTMIEVPAPVVEWVTPDQARVRVTGPPDPGVESILIEWRKAADGDLLASTTTPKSWKVIHRIDGVRVRSTADVDLAGDDPARAAYYPNRTELWVWWRGDLIHRGPLRQRSWGIPEGGQSADDGMVWIDGIVMLDDDPTNPFADELDTGRILSMAQTYARRLVPYVGGGELSSEVPILRDMWVDKPAGPIVDEIALGHSSEWAVVPDPEDGTYRVKWSPEWGRNIGSGEFVARCHPGGAEERDTVTVASGQETGTDVAGRIFARSAEGRLAIHTTDLWGDDLFLERFVQAPTGMEDPAELEFLALQSVVAGDGSATLNFADVASARIVRIGDRVVCEVLTSDVEINGVGRVMTWEVGSDGASITMGSKPRLEESTLWRRWQDRLRELEERRDRPTLGSLDDVRIEDPDDPDVIADPLRYKDRWAGGYKLTLKTRSFPGGKTIQYVAPGPAEAESPDQWQVGPIGVTSGSEDYGEFQASLLASGMEWDPDRPWRGIVSVYVSATPEAVALGWQAFVYRWVDAGAPTSFTGFDLVPIAANSYVASVPVEGSGGWPALFFDSGALAYEDPDATVSAIVRIRQL